MDKEYKAINTFVSSPHNSLFKSGRNDKAKCSTIICCNSENCDLYKRGECSWVAPLGYHRCPYGEYNQKTGFTRRAKAYHTWINKNKEEYKESLNKLKSHSNILAKVGEYIFLPYSFMTKNEKIPFLGHGSLFSSGNGFLLEKDFTIDNIILMCDYKPYALMGGEITDYQKEEVPKFIKHLCEKMPDIYKELCLKYERAVQIEKDYSYIGRKALLNTITPNVGELIDIHQGRWVWDGNYLTSHNSHASFLLTNKFSEIRILPDKNIEIKITDDKQVNKDTVFLT